MTTETGNKNKVPPKGSFLMIDKNMIMKHGNEVALFMANVVDKYFYFLNAFPENNGEFFLTHKDQIPQTGLTDHKLRKCKEIAKVNDWVEIRRKGSPAKEWYTLNTKHPEIQPVIENFKNKSLRISRTSHGNFKGHIRKTNNKENINKNNTTIVDEEDGRISFLLFDKFWKLYPRKMDKGKAKTEWDRLCKKDDRPNWIEIKKAIRAQIKSERWQDPKFIPYPVNWIKDKRWLDDPDKMINFKPVEKDGERDRPKTAYNEKGRKVNWTYKEYDPGTPKTAIRTGKKYSL